MGKGGGGREGDGLELLGLLLQALVGWLEVVFPRRHLLLDRPVLLSLSIAGGLFLLGLGLLSSLGLLVTLKLPINLIPLR